MVAVWVAALVLGSVASGETKAAVGTQGDYHRVWHVVVFAATVVVVGWCLAPVARAWQAAVAAFLLGMLCELLQRLIYIPVVEWADVRDDAAGAAAGWLVLALWRRWRVGQPEAIAL